ncbi:MAG: lanthionine synthetase C family protein [Pseudonocardiaceae bacterium]
MTALAAGEPARLADALAGRLVDPRWQDSEQRWQGQSLARGAAGVALLHIERALAGSGPWATAHAWVRTATRYEISAADDAGLYLGVPAISFVLHAAGADEVPRYGRALARLDAHVARLAHRRVDTAMARIDRGEIGAFAEYDLFYGLTGIGQLLLQRDPGSDALGRILGYLVRLTQPLRLDGTLVPGWWASHDPDPLVPTPGGHGNVGIAHGITGPLALLAHAMRRGIVVAGHLGAIARICAHLDAWRQDGESGPWWPQWITRDDLRTGRVSQTGPLRPSWCYGTPGIARAQQIAAIATGDTSRQMMAEQALASCLSDPAQLHRITDTGLCHGWSGLYQTAWRAARDALTPTISTRLPHLADLVTRHAEAAEHHHTGLLDGTAGLALALRTATRATAPISGWDSCLLIT